MQQLISHGTEVGPLPWIVLPSPPSFFTVPAINSCHRFPPGILYKPKISSQSLLVPTWAQPIHSAGLNKSLLLCPKKKKKKFLKNWKKCTNQWFTKHSQSCGTITTLKFQNIFMTSNETLWGIIGYFVSISSYSPFLSSSQPRHWQPLIYLLSPWNYLF